MKAADLSDDFQLHDLKKIPIEKVDLDFLATKVDSLKDLVNKRSRRIKELQVDIENLSDVQLLKYFQTEYTFIKRPIFIIGDQVFIGNAKKTVEELFQYMQQNG